MAIVFFNTLTRRKEPFLPIDPARVRMYHCGPTVYSYAHLGNFATFIVADLLRRYLEYSGHSVLQVMNITDVGHLTDDSVADSRGEDKLEKKAREEKKDPWQIARFYEAAFQRDRAILNILPAHHYPRATEHVPEMIEMIRELLAAGLAYVAGDTAGDTAGDDAGGQVYFEIGKFPRYGILSGNTPEELLAGAGNRVEEDPRKRNPLDFCLWKKDPHHIMQWDSPWGRGFPGWHIECSAMSRRYLGAEFDIHTGGEDNIFPHHECEIAQSSGGTGRIFARYWLHRRHIQVNGKKMSKSEGNFFTVSDLLAKGFTGPEIRYSLLSAHYRSSLNFTLEGLEGAREALRRLRDFEDDLRHRPPGGGPGEDLSKLELLAREADSAFRRAMDDDLNLPAALGAVFNFIRDAHRQVRTREGGEAAVARLREWDRVLGVLKPSLPLSSAVSISVDLTVELPPKTVAPRTAAPGTAGGGAIDDESVARLLGEREEARKSKDFARADRIRDDLKARGVTIKDGPQGTRWTRD